MKIKVTPGIDGFILNIVLMFFLMLFGIQVSGSRGDSFYGILAGICGVWAAIKAVEYRNRRLTAYDRGIVFRNMWGNVTRVRYEEITAVKICSNGRLGGTRAEFYLEDQYVGFCCSGDKNYGQLMEHLFCIIPDRIMW